MLIVSRSPDPGISHDGWSDFSWLRSQTLLTLVCPRVVSVHIIITCTLRNERALLAGDVPCGLVLRRQSHRFTMVRGFNQFVAEQEVLEARFWPAVVVANQIHNAIMAAFHTSSHSTAGRLPPPPPSPQPPTPPPPHYAQTSVHPHSRCAPGWENALTPCPRKAQKHM